MPAPAHRAIPDSGRVGRSAGETWLPEDVGDRVLDRLTAVGLVDDADFAADWVQSRRANAGKSRRALAAELQAKGSTRM